jgi:hypothetical protein
MPAELDTTDRTPTLQQERDRVAGGRLLLAVAAIVVSCVVGAGLVWLELGQRIGLPAGTGALPRGVPEVRQTLIDFDQSAARHRAAQRHQLETYGWVDREQGVIHIPIERAMQLEVQEATP